MMKKDNRPRFLQERDKKTMRSLQPYKIQSQNGRKSNKEKEVKRKGPLFKEYKDKHLPDSIYYLLALTVFLGMIGAVFSLLTKTATVSPTSYEKEVSIIEDILAFHKENGDYKVTKDKVYIIASPLTVEDSILSKTWSEQKQYKANGRKEVSFSTVITNENTELETTHDLHPLDKQRMMFLLEDVEKVDMVKYNYSKDIFYDDAPETFEYAIGDLHEYPAIDLTSDDERVQEIVQKLQGIGYPLGVLSQKETEERNKKYRELQNVIDGNKEFKKVHLKLSEHNVHRVTGYKKFPKKEVGDKQVNPMRKKEQNE